MNDFIIITDSSCDISPDTLKEWGIKYCPLTLSFNNDSREYANDEIPVSEFYSKMREGGIAKTAAANAESYKTMFTSVLESGLDILFIGFSSGLSATYNSACIAMEDLREAYPDRKMLAIDSLSASAGFGLLLSYALDKKNSGASIFETADYVTSLIPNLCHWFTVDDLVYLKRGGRISSATALAGSLLGVKPVLHVDNEGHLVNVTKVRGRKASLKALADKFEEYALKYDQRIYISHGDCLEDAETLADMLKQRFGATVELITYVGPVIGAHSGPGTLALFFLGKER